MDDVHVRNKTNVVKLAAAERVNQGPLVLTLSAPLGLSTSIFSLQYQYKEVLREYKNWSHTTAWLSNMNLDKFYQTV